MDDSLETDEKPRNNQQNSKVKAVVLVLVGIASLSALIWIFNTPWRYVAPGPTVIQTGKEINKDDLLQLVRQQKKLIVGQVLIKTSTWDSRKKERSWWSTKTAIRGWTMPCRIDVDIDLAKLSPGAFDLVTQGDGTRLLTIRLPNPGINNDQCKIIQPNELRLILNEGDLEQEEENAVQQRAFEKILQNIEETVNANRTAIEDSLKPSAAESFRSLYASLGIERVIVEWESDSQSHEGSTRVE